MSLAITDADAAIAFAQANPETLAMPPVPPRVAPAFEPSERERGRYPGRQIPLNTLTDAFERLAAHPGGDLGGARTRMYEAIATASREVIADIVVRAREDDLTRIARSLQRAAGNLVRTNPAGSDNIRRGEAAIQTAIDGIDGAIGRLRANPDEATGDPSTAGATLDVPGYAPSAGGGRYPGREAVLRELSEAYASIANLPGGELWRTAVTRPDRNRSRVRRNAGGPQCDGGS